MKVFPFLPRPLPSMNEHFQLKAVFDRSLLTYGCLFVPKGADNEERAKSTLISGDIDLAVRPSPLAPNSMQGDQIRLRFDPGFFIAPSEAVVLSSSAPTGYITVQGLSPALSSFRVEASHPQYLALGRDYFQDDAKVIPVHLKSAFWVEAGPGERMAVTVLSDRGQSVSVPVTVSLSDAGACAYAELTWSSLGYFLLSHWHEMLLMAFTAVVCYVVTKAIFQGGAARPTAAGDATAAAAATSMKTPLPLSPRNAAAVSAVANSTPLSLTNADSKPFLWTVDNSPVYGSPRISPRRLTQYSYTDQR